MRVEGLDGSPPSKPAVVPSGWHLSADSERPHRELAGIVLCPLYELQNLGERGLGQWCCREHDPRCLGTDCMHVL